MSRRWIPGQARDPGGEVSVKLARPSMPAPLSGAPAPEPGSTVNTVQGLTAPSAFQATPPQKSAARVRANARRINEPSGVRGKP